MKKRTMSLDPPCLSSRHGQENTKDLVEATGQRQAKISQHLTIMRQRGIVRTERQGTEIRYSLADPRILEACRITREVLLQQLMEQANLAKPDEPQKARDIISPYTQPAQILIVKKRPMAQQHSLSTPSSTITIAQAQPSDIDIVISILEEAGQWLLERGIYQWLPGSFRRDRIASTFELGQVYLAKQGEEVIGTLTLQ
jgi:ArsR family transcriptional regulator, virulence genes transcriptional regulator